MSIRQGALIVRAMGVGIAAYIIAQLWSSVFSFHIPIK